MAVYKIFPTQDATIYSAYPNMNTGLDEIIEASTNFKTGESYSDGQYPQASRFLIKFSPSEITDIIDNKISGSTWTSNLRCFVANITGLSNTTTLNVNALYEDWNMGTGRFNPVSEITNGTSWIWSDYSGSTKWSTGSYIPGSTGSYDVITNPSSSGGGVWYIQNQSSQTFNYYSDLDLNVNVKNIITNWYSGDFNNYGFIIRQDQEFINNINNQTEIKYFSRDTHTIYPPCLEFKWDDSTYSTGSLAVLNTTPATITLDNNYGTYYSSSVNIFRVNSRPEYPVRVWSTSSYYTTNYALPEASYYAVKDLDTDEYVIDFDTTYTKLSCDASGSYFTMYMNGLEPERYYKILIQTTINSNTVVFDNNYNFKVING